LRAIAESSGFQQLEHPYEKSNIIYNLMSSHQVRNVLCDLAHSLATWIMQSEAMKHEFHLNVVYVISSMDQMH